MEKEKIQHFKEKLLEEQTRLLEELGGLGVKKTENPSDWEATPSDITMSRSDKNEAADAIEEFAERTAVTDELEVRLSEVAAALDRIDAGAYGTCEVSEKPIEEDRLEANPAARTCKEHINEKV